MDAQAYVAHCFYLPSVFFTRSLEVTKAAAVLQENLVGGKFGEFGKSMVVYQIKVKVHQVLI